MPITSHGQNNLERLRAGVWAVSVRIPIFAVVVILTIAMLDVVKVYSARPTIVLHHVSVLNSAQEASSGLRHH